MLLLLLILLMMIVDLVVIVVAMGHSKYSLQYLHLQWHGWMCLIIDGDTSTGIIIVPCFKFTSSQFTVHMCTTVVNDAAQSNFPSILHISLEINKNKSSTISPVD
jgi:hypothetical protein